MLEKTQMTKDYLLLCCRLFKNKPNEEDEDASQAGVNKASKGGIIYGDYLQVKQQNISI